MRKPPVSGGGLHFIPMELLDRFRSHLVSLALPPGRALVAVSGGPDSMVLLDLLTRSAGDHGQELVVAHLDHGIAAGSGQVASVVRDFATARGLVCESAALALGSTAT